MDARGLERLEDLATPAPRRARHREQDRRNVLVLADRGDARRREHLEAADQAAVQRLVVVDERDGLVAVAAAQRRRELRTGRAGAVDHDVLDADAARMEHLPDDEARRGDVDDRQRPVDHEGFGRDRLAHQRGIGDGQQDHRGRHAHQHGHHRAGPDVAHDGAIQAEAHEHGDRRQQRGDVEPGAAAEAMVERAELEGQGRPEREGDGDQVGRDHQGPLAGTGKRLETRRDGVEPPGRTLPQLRTPRTPRANVRAGR